VFYANTQKWKATVALRGVVLVILSAGFGLTAGCAGGDSSDATGLDAGNQDPDTDPDSQPEPDGSVDPECVEGTVGCACAAGESCTAGNCVDGTCLDCFKGADGCRCNDDGSCGFGFRCNSSTVCETCPAGEDGCACGAENACDGALVCLVGMCAVNTCSPGALGCPCDTESIDAGLTDGGPTTKDRDTCTGDAYCSTNAICLDCEGAGDRNSCECDTGGDCAVGYECDDANECWEIVDCAKLREWGECDPNQVCNDLEDGPECVPETCNEPYHWNDSIAKCILQQDCERGLSTTIFEECTEERRACDELVGDDQCGACFTDYVYPDAGTGDPSCFSPILCDGAECASDEYCDRFVNDGQGGYKEMCKDWPCTNLSQVKDLNGSCVDCTGSCNAVGTTGRFWPYHDNEDKCVCETRPDYWAPAGGDSLPKLCDADNDGWMRSTVAEGSYSRQEGIDYIGEPVKQTKAQNARCAIREVDRIYLEDGYGVRATVWSCDATGLKLTQPPAEDRPDPCISHPLQLVESERNDVPENEVLMNDDSLRYGYDDDAGIGRHLRAQELNALTKACTSLNGDFNDYGGEDISEVQDTRADTTGLTGAARLASFSYFVELHYSYYESPINDDQYGALVIAERNRCYPDEFALVTTAPPSTMRSMGRPIGATARGDGIPTSTRRTVKPPGLTLPSTAVRTVTIPARPMLRRT
jgi:hypothetical protein